MDFLKGAYDVVMSFMRDNELLTACLAVLGGLKVVASRTKNQWDDKALALVEWPIKKALEMMGKLVGSKK